MLVVLRVVFAGVLVAFATVGSAAPVPAERVKVARELAALAAKFEGTWRGDAGCQGDLTLRANGTYEWKHRGPGGDTEAGVWALRGEVSSPVLSLKCQTADDPEQKGKTVDAKVVRLGEASLVIKHPEATKPMSFTRAMKEPQQP